MSIQFFFRAFAFLASSLCSTSSLAQCEVHLKSYYAEIRQGIHAAPRDFQGALTERRLESDDDRISKLSLPAAKEELPTALEDVKDADTNGSYGESPAARFRVCQLQRRIAWLSQLGSNGAGKFGALAINEKNGNTFGWAIDYPSNAAAQDKALDECTDRSSRGCSVVMVFNNSCASYAVDTARSSTAYGWALGTEKEQVDNRAVQECARRGGAGSQCVVRVWGCSSR